MKRITIPEHGQIVLWRPKTSPPEATERIAYLEERLYRCLERHEKDLKRNGKPVFTWYSDSIKANQWVGVVQVPGLQVEILPKVDNISQDEIGDATDQWGESRRNLLYMLAVAGDVPVRSRDISRLATRRAPLNETLSALFANALKGELLRGCERSYLSHEQNLRTFKGRLLVGQQLLKNAAHRERFYCRFDQFSEDTVMNRIFKAACRFLLDVTRLPGTQDALRHCLLLFDEVRNVEVTDALFDNVTFNRQNERFENLFHFCRLIIGDRSPTVSSGKERSFSLLFDMNKVFERFIAAFIHDRVMPNIPGCRLYPQARRNRRPLFQNEENRGVLLLEPDILIKQKKASENLIIDTKWKSGRVSSGDLYQLYAYTQRYCCGQSVLLYPRVSGSKEQDLDILDDKNEQGGRRVSIRLVNINRDLYKVNERKLLASELELLVRAGIGIAAEGNA
jgi:5-methylcytosine-specific restriction enzyme subunit McrC